jgi:hypothetical protein
MSDSITTLSDQFEDALTHLELREKRRRVEKAHTEIRSHVENDDQLRSWGIDTVLIGSYARHTAIYPGKDVDVFAKLTELDTSVNPATVFEGVRDVLVSRYGERARPQARSIKVTFPSDGGEDFHADVVPAVRNGRRWAIPRRDTTLWEADDVRERWVETDPEEMTRLASEMNTTLSIGGHGAFVPVVKLVRQTRRQHRGKEKPGGFYFELMTYWTFDAGISGDSFAEVLAKTLRSISTQLASGDPLIDPVLGTAFRPQPDPADRAAAATVFSSLAEEAERALSLNRCPAAVAWRSILGENDRGPVFPLPPGCDEEGNEIKNVAAVTAVGSKEASGFA